MRPRALGGGQRQPRRFAVLLHALGHGLWSTDFEGGLRMSISKANAEWTGN